MLFWDNLNFVKWKDTQDTEFITSAPGLVVNNQRLMFKLSEEFLNTQLLISLQWKQHSLLSESFVLNKLFQMIQTTIINDAWNLKSRYK